MVAVVNERLKPYTHVIILKILKVDHDALYKSFLVTFKVTKTIEKSNSCIKSIISCISKT